MSVCPVIGWQYAVDGDGMPPAAPGSGRVPMTADDPALDDAADDLYGCSPAEFVARRTELVKQARADGDRALAARIARLRRPTQVAWVLNQWIRRYPDAMEAIAALGDDLREAQRRAATDRLRALSARRSDVVAGAASAVRRVAADLGIVLSASAERELTATLRAAIADDSVARVLEQGRMAAATEYSGFGPAGIFPVPDAADAPAAASGAGEASAAPDEAVGDPDRVRGLEAEMATAEEAVAVARTALDGAVGAERAAAATVAELVAETDRLRAELARVDSALGFARRRADTARADKDTAAGDLERAERAATRIRRQLDAEVSDGP